MAAVAAQHSLRHCSYSVTVDRHFVLAPESVAVAPRSSMPPRDYSTSSPTQSTSEVAAAVVEIVVAAEIKNRPTTCSAVVVIVVEVHSPATIIPDTRLASGIAVAAVDVRCC